MVKFFLLRCLIIDIKLKIINLLNFVLKNVFFDNKNKELLIHIDINDIIGLYNSGVGSITIAKKYNIGYPTILNILRKNKVNIRDSSWVLTNRPPFKGHRFSLEEKEKIKEGVINFYKKNPDARDRARQTTIKQIQDGRISKYNTSIEKIMKLLLTDLKIAFEYQYKYGFWCFDFYIPKYKLFIECDGDYWHGNPRLYEDKNLNKTQKNNIYRGFQKQNYVVNNGLNMLRFWEYDIKRNIEDIREKICKAMNI